MVGVTFVGSVRPERKMKDCCRRHFFFNTFYTSYETRNHNRNNRFLGRRRKDVPWIYKQSMDRSICVTVPVVGHLFSKTLSMNEQHCPATHICPCPRAGYSQLIALILPMSNVEYTSAIPSTRTLHRSVYFHL